MELSQCGRFAVPAVLLLLTLADGPKSGASIAADLSRVTDRRLRAGTLYGTIARLEQAGLIEPCADLAVDQRRSYRLTAAGHTAAQQQIAHLLEGSGQPINSRYPRVRDAGKAVP